LEQELFPDQILHVLISSQYRPKAIGSLSGGIFSFFVCFQPETELLAVQSTLPMTSLFSVPSFIYENSAMNQYRPHDSKKSEMSIETIDKGRFIA
jgi:hypothetical protein